MRVNILPEHYASIVRVRIVKREFIETKTKQMVAPSLTYHHVVLLLTISTFHTCTLLPLNHLTVITTVTVTVVGVAGMT